MRLGLITIVLVGAALAGCGYPEREGAEILVDTAPPDAACAVTRLGHPIAEIDPTPGIFWTDKTAAPLTVQCRRHGFRESVVTVPAVPTSYSYEYAGRIEIALTPLGAR